MEKKQSSREIYRRFVDFIRCRKIENENPNGTRKIEFNRPVVEPKIFVSNRISTSKYSLVTFLPKFLYEQFKKYSNIFFLCVVVFQQLPGVSPTGRYTTLIPLVLILCCAALKEIIEDVKRHVQDRSTNRRKTLIFQNGSFIEKTWREVRVGDFLRVEKKQPFPADLLFLSSSEPNSICYVETSNLDGETNLKVQQSLLETSTIDREEKLSQLRGEMEYDLPNRNLYEFKGTLKIDQIENPIFLSNKQILLRGSKLENTDWIFGLVLYTGHDTKLMMNSSDVPSKQTNLEKQTNRQILFLLGLLLLLCLISSIAAQVLNSKVEDDHWYLGLSVDNDYSKPKLFFSNFLTFFILYNNLIPISLQITVDLVKFFQAFFINWDSAMYDEESDTPANARTSNLNEELGQIKYVFSDKTGTLTRNEMFFRKCSIAGISYDSKDSKVFKNNDLITNLENHENGELIREFLVLLSVCHTVIANADADPNQPNTIEYQASSPDECALVNAAKDLSVVFYQRRPKSVLVNFRGQIEEYQILNVLEFNSDRKRMSVIVSTPDDKIKLLCKGADSIIMERLDANDPWSKLTAKHLEEYATDGLRTLCLASRELKRQQYNAWSVEYERASLDIIQRDVETARLAAEIEKDLKLLGATGIEDKLQDKVPESLEMLLEAGIRVWVLTGDKKETAINIAYSCRIISDEYTNHILDFGSLEETRNALSRIQTDLDRNTVEEPTHSLIIEGKTLGFALSEECLEIFKNISLRSRTVICCRVTPRQKAQVVEMVKDTVDAITLAIGDGANDVSMIQAAHVGIGIMGREGVQAASASDYTIGQFQFLTRLLFVHGAWNYRRLCKVLLYSFYKNICLYVMELWFQFNNGFSGQILFEQWTIGLYNVIFTAAPPMALGLLDRSASAQTMMNNPKLYQSSQNGSDLNSKIFATWILTGICHSVILYFMSFTMFTQDIGLRNGQVGDHYFIGNMIYTYTVFVVCGKAGLETDAWTWLTHLAIWGSIAAWLVFFPIYSQVWKGIPIGAEMYGMANHVYVSGPFWFGLFLIPVTTLLIDYISTCVQRRFAKTILQEVQEKERQLQEPSVNIWEKIRARLNLRRTTKGFQRSSLLNPFRFNITNYRGYAFSQEENGNVRQTDLISQRRE